MQITILGRRWRLELVDILPDRALGQVEDGKKPRILVRKRLSDEGTLEALISSALTASDWKASEDKISRIAKDIARIVTRQLGYGRKMEGGPAQPERLPDRHPVPREP